MTEDGYTWWKLADFGLVKLLGENAQGDFYAHTECGTPSYMAPEVGNVSIECVFSFNLHRSGPTTNSPSQATSGPLAASWLFTATEASILSNSHSRI